MTVRELVVDVLATELEVDPSRIVPTATLQGDFHADSIKSIEIIMALEDVFGIEIPVDNLRFTETVQTLLDFLAARGLSVNDEAPASPFRSRHLA